VLQHVAADAEVEHLGDQRLDVVGHDRSAPLDDAIEEIAHVAPRDGLREPSLPVGEDVDAEHPVVLLPAALLELGVPLDVLGGELGDCRSLPLGLFLRLRVLAAVDGV
jgi:hypothetical protein